MRETRKKLNEILVLIIIVLLQGTLFNMLQLPITYICHPVTM